MTSSSYCELEHTLEDGAWKDSFDKLLDIKPVLREKQILKKDVRPSFNNDSSVENSRELSGFLKVPAAPPPKKIPTKISTPVLKLPRQPFKCSISPITDWKFQLIRINKKKKNPVRSTTKKTLQSTVINPEVIVVDYDDAQNKTKEAPEPIAAKDTTLSDLLKPKKSLKRVPGVRQVFFDMNVHRKSTRNSVEQQKSKEPERKTSPKKQRISKNRSSHEKKRRKSPTDMTLQPGKWRKSLSSLRRTQMTQDQTRRSSQRNVCRLEVIADCDESVEFINVIPATHFVGKRKTILVKPENVDDSEQSIVVVEDYRERVLQCCNQIEPAPFDTIYNLKAMPGCSKIGEGVYGEVFLKSEFGVSTVCKIVPIEGAEMVNGEVQKTFEQILPEIVISKELCNLNDMNADNATSGFVEIKKVTCIQGKYPDHLIKHWEAYDKEKGSENDHPGDLLDTQLYIVLELEFAGKDLESFVFDNAEQSYAALKQIVLTIAVAEEALEFEHRDLHWGNVLIRPTIDSEFTYKLSGKTLTLPSMGIKATIIDYTLSRMKHKNHCFYNDLTNDEELFSATGDYQFDIYRMMRNILKQNWERYEPKTNIYWISYIISKMINGVKYNNTRSKGHTQYLRKMRALRNDVLEYSSAVEFVEYLQSN